MLKVSPATSKEDCIAIQNVFNHKDIIGLLGGFCMLDGLIGKLKSSGVSLFKAEVDGVVVGGMEIGGRAQCHYFKYGSVGVLPEYQRRRIGTALYVACTFQGILEGRRLAEDTIIADNPVQFMALPQLGIDKVGVLPMKTASFKDIAIFAFHVNETTIALMLRRLPVEILVEIVEDEYSKDLWQKNNDIYKVKRPEYIPRIEACRNMVKNDKRIAIIGRWGRPVHPGTRRTSNTLF